MGYVTIYPTPVLNTINNPFKVPLQKDSQGRILEMETILFPHTPVHVLEKGEMWRIETTAYPSTQPLYVDARFLREEQKPQLPVKPLPSVETILKITQDLLGTRYFWGGNWPKGIPQMLEFYPDLKSLNQEELPDACCLGIDCSGLFYYATNGYTPRNTSDLINFGKEVSGDVKPLDLIAWRGHVLGVISPSFLIESRIGKGVVTAPFKERMEEIIETLEKSGKQLHIRRWHPEQL